MKIAFCVAEDINLGAGYIMAYLKKEGHDVKLFFDPLQGERGYSRSKILSFFLKQQGNIIKRLIAFQPNVCCFSCITAHYRWGLDMAQQIKQKIGCKIIFGGVHATLIPEEVRRHSFIDEVVEGDGIMHFGGGLFDPDKLWPDRESFFKVLPPIHRQVQLFMTSYGCPFNCSFCGNEQLRKVKHYRMFRRNADNCIRELMHLKRKWGMRYVLFVDDIFTSDKKWLIPFLRQYNLLVNRPFACFGHVRFLDAEIISALADCGCHTIWLGIQTADERLRKQVLNRPETNKEIIDVCALIKKAGIKLMVDHIFGIPTENTVSQDASLNLYDVIKPDIINCYDLLYFPKAKIIEYAIKTGYLFPKDVAMINEGKGITYQVGNRSQRFVREYAKTFVARPIGGLWTELLPMWLLKVIVHLKAGRAFILRAIIQNELYFTWQAIKKKWLRLF